jgi:O-antigen ligase
MKIIHMENKFWSSILYPLLVASLGFGTISIFQIYAVNIRIWEVLIILYILTLIISYTLNRKIFLPNKLALFIMFPLLFSVLLSGINSNSIGFSIKQALLFFGMSILFLIVSQRWSRAQLLQNIRWIIYPGILVAGWGVVEFFVFPEILDSYSSLLGVVPRAKSFFAEPNEFSQFLGLPFAFLFSALIYRHPNSTLENLFFTFGLLLVIFAQFITFSRGGAVVFLSQIIVWFFLDLYYVRGVRRTYISIKFILIMIAIMVTSMLFIFPGIDDLGYVFLERMESFFSESDATTSIRLESIKYALLTQMESFVYIIFGTGFGSLSAILGDGVATTSNIFVDIFVELGFVGLLAFLFFLICILILPLKIIRSSVIVCDDKLLTVFFGSYLSFVGMLFGGLTYATHMLNIFWFSCGIVLAVLNYKKNIGISHERI